MPDSTRIRPGCAAILAVLCCPLAGISLAGSGAAAQAPAAYDRIPFGQNPIDYFASPPDNLAERLNRRLQAGQTTLEMSDRRGYLEAILRELKIPVASQLLVFSKTAVNQHWVSPRTPRAIYFNEEAYVAWVPHAPSIEVTVIDAAKGALFYQLRQDGSHPPRLERESRCLGCHVGRRTLEVPGLSARSFFTGPDGTPLTAASDAGEPVITHATPFANRWGGWYVTGPTQPVSHMGNTVAAASRNEAASLKESGSLSTRPADLQTNVDLSAYLSTGSDVVAHLVFNHQVHGQNLLTRVSYEARLGRQTAAVEELLRYLFCVDEVPLPGILAADSVFAGEFQRGEYSTPRSLKLRRLDLKTRLFKHRLSYLVDTPMFEALPMDVKSRLYRRMWEMLTDGSADAILADVPPEERTQIADLLRAAKHDLPAVWHARTVEPVHPERRPP